MQRSISLIILIGSFLCTCAQNQDLPLKIDYSKTVVFKDVAISFVKVLSDSRCPKNVQCVQAGEAKVLVRIK